MELFAAPFDRYLKCREELKRMRSYHKTLNTFPTISITIEKKNQ